jgi:hypothetical protein
VLGSYIDILVMTLLYKVYCHLLIMEDMEMDHDGPVVFYSSHRGGFST